MPAHDPGDLQARFANIEAKLEAVFVSVEKTRRYFLWMLVAMLLSLAIPFIGLVFAIPSFLSTYSQMDSLLH